MRVRQTICRIIEHKSTPYIVTSIILVVMLFPFYWTLNTSFKTLQEAMRPNPTYFPQNITLDAYVEVFLKSPMPRYILNSTLYATVTVAIVLVSGVLTAYGLSKFKYRGSNFVLLTLLATRIIPPISMLLPFYMVYRWIGLINTRASVIIFSIYLCYPLVVWILKQFFDQFPDELLESARIDGCGRLETFWKVVLPNVAPGIAAVSIVSFLWTWQQFLGPYLFLNTNANKPITVGVYYFVGDQLTYWNQISAAAIFAAIPGILFFLFSQKYIVKGLTLGSVKG